MQGHVSNGIGLRRGVGLNANSNVDIISDLKCVRLSQDLRTSCIIVLGDRVAANLRGNCLINAGLCCRFFSRYIQGHLTKLGTLQVTYTNRDVDLVVLRFRRIGFRSSGFRSESLEGNCGCQQKHHQQQAEKLFANCFHFYSS